MKKDYLSRLNINQILTNLIAVFAVVCLSAFSLQAQSDATVSVTAPAGAETDIAAILSVFGPTTFMTAVSGPVAEGIDTSGAALGCGSVTADLTGAIALIDRGVCGFQEKAVNAVAAGAVGVIVCNTELAAGVDQRYKAITMGPTAPDFVGVPVVMIPFQQCADMRVNLGSGLEATISPTVLPVDAGETCDEAIEIGPGAHTVADLVNGYGGRLLFANVSNAAWYSYTPTSNVLATVSSCGLTDADTRLYVFTGTDCTFGDLVIVGTNDDCDPDNANFSSELSFLAIAGTRYWIYWDDRWDFNGFDFELTEGALPEVAVTFNVIMANETVSGDGVSMVYAGPGADGLDDVTIVPLADDDGDGIWSGSATLTALDTIGYAFVNGDVLAGGEIEPVPNDCGVDGGFGFNVRPLIIGSASDFTVPAVCFGTCLGFCPEEGCAQAPVVLENLDSYELGFVGPQSAVWTTWSGAGGEGTAEDATVSNEQFFSAPNSVKIEGQNGPVDALVLLGNQTEGNWLLKFKMYIEAGRNGYYNIQNDETPGQQWNLETQFNASGTVTIAGQTATGTYPPGEWFDVIHRIDLDNDLASLSVAGKHVLTWQYGPDWKIGSIDLYPTNVGPHVYYVDDIELRPLEPCPEGAIICDGFETYNLSEVSDQSADWGPWTSSPADDGIVTGEIAYEGCNSLKISEDDPDDQLLLLGDRTTGNYLLEWQMYVPAGSLGYYNFQKFQNNPGNQFGMQVEWFADGTVTLDAGAADVRTFNWTADTWMHFQHFIDLDNNWISLVVDGVEIYGWPASWTTFTQTGAKQIGSVDFFGNTGNLYYLDNVRLIQLPSLPGNACVGSQSIQNVFGQGIDNLVSAGPYDNTNYTTTAQDPDFGWECFGEPDGGGAAPTLERTMWFTFVGDGNEYFIEALACGDNPIGDSDTQMAIYSGGCGNLTPVDCVDDGVNAVSGYYPASLTLQTEPGVTYYMMIDGFGPDFEQFGEYCIEVTQKTLALVTVTFQVDAFILNQGGTFEGTMYLAGSFSGFNNIEMADGDGDGIWTVDVAVEPNTAYTYKFKNGPDGWESVQGDCTVGEFGDRQVEVAGSDITLDVVCFNYCVTCVEVSIDELTLQGGVKIFPNPAKELLNVRVDLPEAADNLSIRMLNAFGQVVSQRYLGSLQTGNIEIDVTNIPAGAYMIQVMDGKAQFTQAVIVE